MDKSLLSVGETSSWIGCSKSTLKKYEDEGLLIPVVEAAGRKRLFSSKQVKKFIIEQCGGSESALDEEYGGEFLSSIDVKKRLSVSYELVNILDRQGLLSPRRRLPLSHKRLYLKEDVDKFLETVSV